MASEPSQSVHYIHRMNYSVQEKIVGIFILLAIGMFFFLFFVNSQTSHLFDDYITLNLYVKNAEGIASDTPVRISGIEVGKVDKVEFAPDHRIRIVVRVYERYQSLLRQDSSAAIGKLSLLGRSSIELSAGSPELPPLKDGTALLVDEPLSFEQLIAELTPVVRTIEQTVQHVAKLMLAIEPDKLHSLLDNLHLASQDMQQISTQVASGRGALGMALYDEQFQHQLSHASLALQASLQSAEQRLQQLGPILENLHTVSEHSHEAAEYLPELMAETTLMVNNINTSLTSLNMEIKQLPDLITRMNMLMEQTDRLLEGVANSWLFSSSDARQRRQLIGVQPPHE